MVFADFSRFYRKYETKFTFGSILAPLLFNDIKVLHLQHIYKGKTNDTAIYFC